jgi:branched-chain amino acid aminotransferase
LPYSKIELKSIVEKVLLTNNMQDGVHVRIMVTRGIKKTPSQDPRLTISGPNLVIIPEYKTQIPVQRIKESNFSLLLLEEVLQII